MATASVPGFRAALYLATSSSGVAIVKFGELKDFTLTVAQGALDATSKDSAGWKEFLSGLNEWGGSGSGLYLLESSNGGQVSAWAALTQGNLLSVTFYEGSSASITGGTTWQKYTGTAVITGFDIESPLDGAAGLKIALKGTGPITKAAATS